MAYPVHHVFGQVLNATVSTQPIAQCFLVRCKETNSHMFFMYLLQKNTSVQLTVISTKKTIHETPNILWYLIPFPLILKPYFISISYKGLNNININIRRNVNSVMLSNVLVLHHIAYSLIPMWNICPVSDPDTMLYIGANSPDQTCFLTHKPSITSE